VLVQSVIVFVHAPLMISSKF